MENEMIIRSRVLESIDTMQRLISFPSIVHVVSNVAEEMISCISSGKKLIICGNGGSATDASHFAGEIVGRFMAERSSWPAIVLNSDIATLTSIANDYGYDNVFARQVEGFVQEGDVFIGISTSGNSENVFKGLKTAKEKGAKTVCLVGKDGGRISREADYSILVPSNSTARIQESHILIIHILCEIVEENLAKNEHNE